MERDLCRGERKAEERLPLISLKLDLVDLLEDNALPVSLAYMGNGQTYGYSIVNGKWVVDESQRELVKKMYELYTELHSVRKVRDALNEQGYRNQRGNLFTDENIGRIVKNVMHKGWVILNRHHREFDSKETIEKLEDEWVIVKNDHEAIVSEELWDAVNDEIQSHRNKGNSGTRGKRGGTDLLSGKMVCSCCGRVLWKHASQGSYKSKEGRKYTYKRYTQWYCSGKMGRGELACTDPATISGVKLQKYLVEMADMFLDYSTVEYSKNLLKRRTISWLEDLKDKLTTPNDNGKIEQDLKALEGKRGKLIDLYTDELISKEEFKSRSVDLDAEIEKKRALLVPVEENPDIKAIEDTIANIDAEIEALFEDEAMVEEKKVQFIQEHIKKIYVSKNSDVFIVLDNVAGAFLFIDKEDTRIEVVPVAEYNPEELSEEGITENDFVPFDRESMSFPHGRICYEKIGIRRESRRSLPDRFRCHQHGGNLERHREPGLSAGEGGACQALDLLRGEAGQAGNEGRLCGI